MVILCLTIWGTARPFSKAAALFYNHLFPSTMYGGFNFSTSFCCCSVTKVMSNSLWPHGMQHARLLCPPLSPRVCSNSCPLSHWCYLTISSSATPFSFCLPSFPSIQVFSSELAFQIRWLKYWSFSFSNSLCNEYSGLISFRIDWFGLLSIQGTLKSLLQHCNLKTSVLWCSAFFMV